MSTSSQSQGYREFAALYRSDVVTSPPFKVICGNVKVELFREERVYYPNEHRNLVVAAVKGAQYCSPIERPLVLDTRSNHLILITRTREERDQAQSGCEAAIDKVVALTSALITPNLFRIRLFRGWLKGPPSRNLGPLFMAVQPVEIEGRELARNYAEASLVLSRDPELRSRFALMFRFIAKGLAEPPSEEAYIWLWTALEIFPMVDTSDIRPISQFLSPYLGHPPATVKERLQIGKLFGLRSKLVHDGHLPLEGNERFIALSRLEKVVTAVVRHAAGLPYDGALDHEFSGHPGSL